MLEHQPRHVRYLARSHLAHRHARHLAHRHARRLAHRHARHLAHRHARRLAHRRHVRHPELDSGSCITNSRLPIYPLLKWQKRTIGD